MATWEDGPEYAPAERPTGFAAPPAAPLDQAPAPTSSASAPPARPGDYTADSSQPALSSYLPSPGPQRDPSEPFAVARSSMTEVDSAWGLVHSYHVEGWAEPALVGPDPRAPLQPSGAMPLPAAGPQSAWPQPAGPQPAWPQPVAYPPAEASANPPVGFGAVFNAVTVPTFVTLLIGGLALAVPFFGWLSPLMFVLAFTTAGRMAYRRDWVRNTFLVAAGALATTAVAGFLLAAGDLLGLLDLVAAVSTAICWIVLAALLVIVWQALLAGEEPEEADPDTPRGWG